MVDWTIKFKWQYDYARKRLNDANGYAPEWKDTVGALQKLMAVDGFSPSRADALDKLRKQMATSGGKAVGIEVGLLAAVNAGGNAAPVLTDEAKMRASSLKFLSNTYLMHVSGGRTVWVHSSPKAYLHWPSIHFNSYTSTRTR